MHVGKLLRLMMAGERLSLPVLDATCRSCGTPLEDGHADDCPLAEHQAMLAGDENAKIAHDPDDCYWCVIDRPPVAASCRCGDCCRRLLIEVDAEDARREPKIVERGSPILSAAEVTRSGRRELEGYLLNSAANDGACVFLDQTTNLCHIYGSRPLVCRLFDCDHHDVEAGGEPE
jgi:Putative zinc- or iron-chelating domain